MITSLGARENSAPRVLLVSFSFHDPLKLGPCAKIAEENITAATMSSSFFIIQIDLS
jgi:hypothetical protein